MTSRPCLILFGPPGSGKGTQATLLRDKLGHGAHLDRAICCAPGWRRATSWEKQSQGLCNPAAWCRMTWCNRMVEDRMEQPDARGGFILDGYPRTVAQAKLLDRVLRDRQVRTVVVHLKVDYTVIIARLSGRRRVRHAERLQFVIERAVGIGILRPVRVDFWWFATTIGKKWWSRDLKLTICRPLRCWSF